MRKIILLFGLGSAAMLAACQQKTVLTPDDIVPAQMPRVASIQIDEAVPSQPSQATYFGVESIAPAADPEPKGASTPYEEAVLPEPPIVETVYEPVDIAPAVEPISEPVATYESLPQSDTFPEPIEAPVDTAVAIEPAPTEVYVSTPIEPEAVAIEALPLEPVVASPAPKPAFQPIPQPGLAPYGSAF